MFGFEKTGLRGNLITMFQYLKGGQIESGDFLFIRNHMAKMGVIGAGYSCGILIGHKRKVVNNENIWKAWQ